MPWGGPSKSTPPSRITPPGQLSFAYVWVPVPVKPPLPSAVTGPSELVPSPQLMLAVKSPDAAPDRTSVKVAAVWVNCVPAVASIRVPWTSTVGGAGATLPRLRAVPTTMPVWSWTVTVMGYQPASEYVLVPLTSRPPFGSG